MFGFQGNFTNSLALLIPRNGKTLTVIGQVFCAEFFQIHDEDQLIHRPAQLQ